MRDRNNMPGIPQMSMQVLWGQVTHPGSAQHTGKHYQLWENGSLQEGLHEPRRIVQFMKLKSCQNPK